MSRLEAHAHVSVLLVPVWSEFVASGSKDMVGDCGSRGRAAKTHIACSQLTSPLLPAPPLVSMPGEPPLMSAYPPPGSCPLLLPLPPPGPRKYPPNPGWASLPLLLSSWLRGGLLPAPLLLVSALTPVAKPEAI